MPSTILRLTECSASRPPHREDQARSSFVVRLSLTLCFSAACTAPPQSPRNTADAAVGDSTLTDASVHDSGDTVDTPRDSSPGAADTPRDSSSTTDTNTCGNGQVDGDELCDGDSRICSDLTALFDNHATAPCRPDCSGYDTHACTLPSNAASRSEQVYPKRRDSERFAHAVCNDGSPFRFEVSLTGSRQWVVFFEGGGACDGQLIPCALRWNASPTHALFSTAGDSFTDGTVGTFRPRQTGILSRSATENPTFSGANIVILNYCSSDLWVGTGTSPVMSSDGDRPESLIFAGRINARATLDLLRQRYGLSDHDDVDVIVTGSSAGGNGARNNADLFAQTFQRAVTDKRVWVIPVADFMLYAWNRPGAGVVGSDLSDAESFDRLAMRYSAELNPRCIAMATADGHGSGLGACMTGMYGLRSLVTAAPVGYGLRVLEASNRTDPVYRTYHAITPTRPDFDAINDAWEPLATQEMLDSTVRWLAAPAYRPMGGRGVNVHGLYEFWTVPFPPYQPTDACGGPLPTGITDLRSMIDAFYRDRDPDHSIARICPPMPWPR